MTTTRFSFTAARLAQVAAPAAGAVYVYDAAMPSLGMRVTKAGARTFVFYCWISGRPVRITLGPVASMSIPDARKAAQQIAGRAAAGVDVVAERAAARVRGRTVGDAFETWLASAKHRKRSWEDDKRLWELWLEKRLTRRTLAEVNTGELERITQQLPRQGVPDSERRDHVQRSAGHADYASCVQHHIRLRCRGGPGGDVRTLR